MNYHPSPSRHTDKQEGGFVVVILLIAIAIIAYLLLRNGCNPA